MSQSEKKNISREDSNIIKNIFNKKTKQRTNYLKNNEKEVKTINKAIFWKCLTSSTGLRVHWGFNTGKRS